MSTTPPTDPTPEYLEQDGGTAAAPERGRGGRRRTAVLGVGGVPVESADQAERAVRAALEIQEYLSRNPDFKARIGIHTGPVVAGVVGRKKFAFDIWGDTVNQAARLEAAGVPGEVTISKATCALLGEDFRCERIGTFDAKNMGTLDRYRVLDNRLMKNPS